MSDENLLLKEGKTKKILRIEEKPGFVVIQNKNDITKNDDSSQTQVMDNKAVHATTTTCAVFSLLKEAGISVAFEKQISETEFIAPECKMIPLEVIIRRYAVGSYLKRFPNLEKQKNETPHRFHKLVFELFLKTTGKKIVDMQGNYRGETTVEDPFIVNPYEEKWVLYEPKQPSWIKTANTGIELNKNDFLPKGVTVEKIEELTRKTFLVLESAWTKLGCRLIDFKIEFGINQEGKLLVSDVIDNDSWRLRTNKWEELSKQLFRDNVEMATIANKYAVVANQIGRASWRERV